MLMAVVYKRRGGNVWGGVARSALRLTDTALELPGQTVLCVCVRERLCDSRYVF